MNVDELVAQSFDMEALLNREIDAAEAMIYNEYAQVLEATNPDTNDLYQPSDLTVIEFNDPSIATAMLEINGLIWPSPSGIGVMDAGLWQQTVGVATSQGVIQGVLSAGSYRSDFAQNAVDALADDGLDMVGNGWQRVTVQLNPGGE